MKRRLLIIPVLLLVISIFFFSFSSHVSATACTAVTTGSWSNGANWSSCNGLGGIPAASDDVVINSGITITQDVDTPSLNSLTINGTLDTSTLDYNINTKNI